MGWWLLGVGSGRAARVRRPAGLAIRRIVPTAWLPPAAAAPRGSSLSHQVASDGWMEEEPSTNACLAENSSHPIPSSLLEIIKQYYVQ
jgi:hypothetical protein